MGKEESIDIISRYLHEHNPDKSCAYEDLPTNDAVHNGYYSKAVNALKLAELAGYRKVPKLEVISEDEMVNVVWDAGCKYEANGGSLETINQAMRFQWIAQAQVEADRKAIEGV